MYAFVSDDSREYSRVGTQVATFSVYAYFLAALFGRQFLEPRGEHRWAQNTLVPWKWQNEIIDNLGQSHFWHIQQTGDVSAQSI